MPPAELEMTIMAAEDLKDVATFGKMNVYAVAWVDPMQRRTTRVLRKGGRNPVWNEQMTVGLEAARRYPGACLTVEVFSQSSIGDKVVGRARIAVQEIVRIAPARGDDDPALVTLQLQRPSGRCQGIISLSLKVTGDPLPSSSSATAQLADGADKGDGDEPVMGIPVNPYVSGGYGGYYGFGPGTSTGYPSLTATQSRSGSEMIPYAHPAPAQAYQQPYYPYSYVQPARPPSRGNSSLLLGLLGGALGGLLLGDILT